MSERGKILEFSSEKREDFQKEKNDGIKTLEIIQVVDPSKDPEILVTCDLIDGVVQFKGDEGVIEELQKEEFYWEGQKVTPDDGEKFLRAVKASYRNPYFLARKIK